ncbi:MAG: DUF5011 domain-containing protein, partial [Actinomycetota bacterium]|nr:DUF5011 domain-containing protein [Actinomycetota bacterium]
MKKILITLVVIMMVVLFTFPSSLIAEEIQNNSTDNGSPPTTILSGSSENNNSGDTTTTGTSVQDETTTTTETTVQDDTTTTETTVQDDTTTTETTVQDETTTTTVVDNDENESNDDDATTTTTSETDGDENNNEDETTTTTELTDTTPPVITLNGEAVINIFVGSVFTDPGASAADDNDESVAVETTGTVNTNLAGTYSLNYNASDASGNAAQTVTRTVNVIPNATIYTDKPDYLPSEFVVVTGSGWVPGETVKLEFAETLFDLVTQQTTTYFAIANAEGNIFDMQYMIDARHLGASFILTATGQTSGMTASTEFKDGLCSGKFKVVDTDNNPISGANVLIDYYYYTDSYETDINGYTSNIYLYYGWNYDYEVTKSGYLKSSGYYSPPNNNWVKTITLERESGSIKIKKEIKDSSLRGVAFEFTLSSPGQTDRTASITINSGDEGNTTVSDLPFGTWTVTEAQGDYICESPSDYDRDVTLSKNNKNETVEFENKAIPTSGSITIKKEIKDSSLRGVAFEFTLSSPGQTDRTASITINSGDEGNTTVSDLPFGTWTVTEAQGGYICESPSDYDTEVTLSADNDKETVKFKNDRISNTGSITIVKEIKDSSLRGVPFEFTLSSPGQTDRTASIIINSGYEGSTKVTGLPYSTWTVTEAQGDYICESPSDYDREE